MPHQYYAFDTKIKQLNVAFPNHVHEPALSMKNFSANMQIVFVKAIKSK